MKAHKVHLAASVSLACALLVTGCASKLSSASSSPQAYTNPVYAASMPDPSVIRHKGVYYAFGTTGNAWDPSMKVRQMCIDRLTWTPAVPRCEPTVTPQPAP